MKFFFLPALLTITLLINAQNSFTDGKCKAFFKYEVNDKMMFPYAATAINFYDASEGKVKEWHWDFGDGSTSREQNPLYIFRHPVSSPNVKINPYRTISLTILTDSCKSYYSMIINIMDGKPYIPPGCIAAFKYYQSSYDSLKGTYDIQFTDFSTGDSLSYLWQFSDGRTSKEKEPLLTFDLKKGKTEVCLTVTGVKNCTNTCCDTVVFYKPIIKPEECKTYFKYAVNYNIQTFAPALVLDFFPAAFPEAKEWKWDFGDGITSSEEKPTHIFNLPLTKDTLTWGKNRYKKVILTIKTSSGCVASWTEIIDIYMNSKPMPTCHAWFKYYIYTGYDPSSGIILYQFTDASEGDVIKWFWEFEDGLTSTETKPLVKLNSIKPQQKVCLTITTSDHCTSTWCETVYLPVSNPDTAKPVIPSCGYSMHITSGFPLQMSSCAGYAHAQVYFKDSVVKADSYSWSEGTIGQDVKNLCPTKTYSVKAKTSDGCVVARAFIFNSDGTVTDLPVTWWITGTADNPVVNSALNGKKLTLEWILCDGKIVRSDTIPLNLLDCSTGGSNLIVRDSLGNIIYTEMVAMKSQLTGISSLPEVVGFSLYPNPVKDNICIEYKGNHLDFLQAEILDISGKVLSVNRYFDLGQGKKIELDARPLAQGIYLCRLISDRQGTIVLKFTK